MEISNRLKKVASYVPKCDTMADIGTDHGYIPIYLVKRDIVNSAIAMDLRRGPLNKAKENVEQYKLADRVELRLSDGLEKLRDNEVQSIVIAGMGGLLTANILEDGKEVLTTGKTLVLQPQSEIFKVRQKIHEIGYKIVEEEMFIDMNKTYTVIVSIKGEEEYHNFLYYQYGKILLEKKSKVLLSFLEKEKYTYEDLYKRLKSNNTDNVNERLLQIEKSLSMIDEAMKYYEVS